MQDEESVTSKEVVEQPNRYIGQVVSLSGEVGDLYDQRAFELEGTRPFFDDDLLVLAKSSVMFSGVPLQSDDDIVVTGRIREFNGPELRKELGWQMPTDLEEDWRAKPVIVATSIAKRQEAWSERETPIVSGALVSVYLSADPQTLAGQGVEVEGARVQSTEGKGLWIGNGARSQMYVVVNASADLPQLSQGERVDVAGVLRKMPAPEQAVRQFGIAREASEHISSEPLYIEASSVEPHRQKQTTETSSVLDPMKSAASTDEQTSDMGRTGTASPEPTSGEQRSPRASVTVPAPPTGTREMPRAPAPR